MASATVVQMGLDNGSGNSATIDPRFFGGNILFDRDSLSGTFAHKADALDLTLLRFPGGGIAEDDFDLTNPDATGVSGMEDHETLSNFLAYCAAQGILPAIVIPTKRYVDDLATGLSDVAAFAADVTAGVYGPVSEVIFEVGNEFYANTLGWDAITSHEYGNIASQFATAIDDAATGSYSISVQAGRSVVQNNNIISYFDTVAEKDAVDGIIIHNYPWTLEVVDKRFDKLQLRLDAWESHGVDAYSFLSEWNIGASPDDSQNYLHDYGLAQSSALVEMIYHAAIRGFDYAAVWGIQHNTKNALSRSDGTTPFLAAGTLFELASEVLQGKQALVDAVTVDANSPVVAHVFEDDLELVVFVSARDFDDAAGSMLVELDLMGFDDGFLSVEGVKLSTDDPVNDPRPVGVQTVVSAEIEFDDTTLTTSVEFEKDYEVIRLRFAKPASQTDDTDQAGGATDDFLAGGSGDDVLRGRQGGDFLASHDGDDLIKGGGGGDQLNGGGGNDDLWGGAGDDKMIGGAGLDQLYGLAGRDDLFGGAGADLLEGGNGRDNLRGEVGDDILNGGTGSDRLWGGAGDDTFIFESGFGTDRIIGFEQGADVLDLSALASVSDFADLSGLISQNNFNSFITLSEGIIILRGFDMVNLVADDFVF